MPVDTLMSDGSVAFIGPPISISNWVDTEFYQPVVRLFAGRAVPGGKSAVQPEVVAEAIVRLLRRPRRAVYVPGRFRVIPWIELGFGWLIDRLSAFFMRRLGSHA